MGHDRNILFSEGDLRETLNAARRKACQEVEQLPANQILNTSESDLVDALAKKYEVQPVRLKLDEMY